MFINDIFRLVLLRFKEALPRGRQVSHILGFLVFSDGVETVLQFVNHSLNLIAVVGLDPDLASCLFELVAALSDCLLMLRTRLRLNRLEFQEGLLFVNRLAWVRLGLAGPRHCLQHLLLLQRVRFLVVRFWELLKLLHPSDFFLAFL